MTKTLKDQGTKIKNDILKFIADRTTIDEPVSATNNIEIFKHFKKVAGYQSLQIEIVNGKLKKLEAKGLIRKVGELTVSNDLTDNATVIGTIAQCSYIIEQEAYE